MRCPYLVLHGGHDVLADWFADRFGVDQRALLKTFVNSLI
jgi:hypothetical protein